MDRVKQRLFRTAFSVAIALLAAPSSAQDQLAPPPSPTTDESAGPAEAPGAPAPASPEAAQKPMRAEAAAAAAAADDGLRVEEVIVTAQKREQRLQDVPLAVTAITADNLESSGVRSVEALSQAVPGLVINNANSLLLPFIRGVGAFNAGAATSSSVAIYVDGLYTPRSGALAFTLDNVQQIEVLKGPQSTLYGRNATGGAITITTATPKPGDPVSGKFSATTGNFGQNRISGTIAGGIADKLAASLTGAVVSRDGYVDNLASQTYFGGASTTDDVNSENEKTINGKLTYAPTENSEFVLSASYRTFDDTSAFSYRQFNGEAVINAFFAGTPEAPIPQEVRDGLIAALPSKKWQTYAPWGYRDGHDTTVNLTSRIDFDDMYLISISGYLDNYLRADTEVYALPIPLAGFAVDWPSKTFSQEFRLHSQTAGPLSWLVGLQYFNEGSSKSRIWGALAPALSPTGQALLSPDADHPLGDSDWKSESYAAFGEVVYAVTDRINLTAGVRDTWEKFSLSDNRDGAFFTAIGFSDVPVPDKEKTWNEPTYRVVLDTHFGKNMAYISHSKGFVSGTLNVQNPAGDVVEPETLVANEVGIKSMLANGRLRLNGAVFDYGYENIHAQTVNGATGLTNLVAGQKATIRGAEMEFDGILTESFSVNGGITYLFDRTYDRFSVPANSDFPAIEASGNTIAGAPKAMALLGLRHEIPAGAGRIGSSVNVSYNSGVFFDTSESVGSGGIGDDAYTVVNLRTTYFAPGDKWNVSLWANNLFEEYYMSGGISSGPSIVAIEAPPRFFGATFVFKL
ncbi:MAG: hypothetical protein JWQ90_3969 [Hydrocarboniphaga sp.]|uniref:TonB-dependent receptor n=1 Tax=Hydrocarboniphaga sp. TaxID=2033016 RepID=UPI002617AC52|nr:TonB-dependent receptor plug domain-containing protein [Hydrocarboniphaga sp.]MDB5971519.1 hypothetical protein [Hydrocarboniphaga sp.]